MARIKAIKNTGDVEQWASDVTNQIKSILDDNGIKNNIITDTALHHSYGDKKSGINVIGLNLKGSTDIAIVISPLANISWRNVEWSKTTLQVNIVYAAKFNNMYDKYRINHNAYRWGRSIGINSTSDKIIKGVISDDTDFNPIISNRDNDGKSVDPTKVGIKVLKSYRNSFSFNKIIALIEELKDFSAEYDKASSLDSILDITTTIHKSTILDAFDDRDNLRIVNHSTFGDNEDGLVTKTVVDEIFANDISTHTYYSIKNISSLKFAYNTELDVYNGMGYSVSRHAQTNAMRYGNIDNYTLVSTFETPVNDVVTRYKKFVSEFNESNQLFEIRNDNIFKYGEISSMYSYILSDARSNYIGTVIPTNLILVQHIYTPVGEAWSKTERNSSLFSIRYTDSITGEEYETSLTTQYDNYSNGFLDYKVDIYTKDETKPQTLDTLEKAMTAIKIVFNEMDSYTGSI